MPFICHPTQMSLASQVKSKGICFKNQILGYMVWRKTVQNCFKIDKIISPKTSKEQKAILAISNIRFGQLDHSEKAVPTGYSKYNPQRCSRSFSRISKEKCSRRCIMMRKTGEMWIYEVVPLLHRVVLFTRRLNTQTIPSWLFMFAKYRTSPMYSGLFWNCSSISRVFLKSD